MRFLVIYSLTRKSKVLMTRRWLPDTYLLWTR